MIDVYTPAKDLIKYFKDRHDYNQAKKEIIKVFRVYHKKTGKRFRSLDAIVKEAGLSTRQTEFVLKDSIVFRRDTEKRSRKEFWTLREFDSES